jgi:cell division protein FtsI (penicillin-binding protein 3)
LAAPVFRDLSDRVVGTRIALTKVGHSNEKKMPTMKFGNKDSYAAICNSLGFNPQLPSSTWLKVREYQDSLIFTPYYTQKDVVPNVVELTIKDALYMLENLGMRVRFRGKGRVISQSIASGSKISDEVIVLELGTNKAKK